MKRRTILSSVALGMAGCNNKEVDREAAEGARIRELDKLIGAVVELLPFPRCAVGSGPLANKRVLVKDNIDTADGMETTAGCLALLGSPAQSDATVVQHLRAAGAYVMGKTNLSEWANFRSYRSTSGWSARGGLTRNPHDLEHSAGGSSAGSAAAVAAGLAWAAVGTETDGSIVCPASFCGVVGLKPTRGLLSTQGIVPITPEQDTAGPLARSVADARLLMEGLMGKRAAMRSEAKLSGCRLGVLLTPNAKPEVLEVFSRAKDKLRSLGAVLVEGMELKLHPYLGQMELRCMMAEFPPALEAYLKTRNIPGLATLRDVMLFNEKHAAKEMPWFGQELFQAAVDLSAEDRAAAKEMRVSIQRIAGEEGLLRLLEEHELDALVCPTNDPAGRISLTQGDDFGHLFTRAPAVAGYPHLTQPMGKVGVLPVGLSWVARPGADALLFALAEDFEITRASD